MRSEFIEKFLADSARYLGRPAVAGEPPAGGKAPAGAKVQIFSFIADFNHSREFDCGNGLRSGVRPHRPQL